MNKTKFICIDRHFDAYECERCRTGWRITSFEDFVYCPKCGRQIDYGEHRDGEDNSSLTGSSNT